MRGTDVTPSCLPVGKTANYTHSNKAINGEATQSQSLYIQNSLNPQNTYPGRLCFLILQSGMLGAQRI